MSETSSGRQVETLKGIPNPYVILCIKPVFEKSLRTRLEQLTAVLEWRRQHLDTLRSVQRDAPLVHAYVQELEAQLKQPSEAGSQENLLHAHYNHFREYLVVTAERKIFEQERLQQLRGADGYRSTLPDAVAAALPPFPEREEVNMGDARFDRIPSIADVQTTVRQVRDAVAGQAGPKKKAKKTPDPLRAALGEIEKVLERQKLDDILNELFTAYVAELDEALELEKKLLSIGRELKDQYRLLARRFHPDQRSGGSGAWFKLINEAYHALKEASAEQREIWTRDFAFGQDTSEWTVTKVKPLQPVAEMLAGLFQRQIPPANSEPCLACNVSGSIPQQQGLSDTLLVPYPCTDCNGTGYQLEGLQEIRQALRRTVQPVNMTTPEKKKKK